jgi:hypothetical protein
VCTSVQRDVPAGEKDVPLAVKVPIKPATLVIVGDFSKHYQIVEHPEVTVRAGTNTIRMNSSYERVTVKVLDAEGTPSRSVRLVPGESQTASF